MSMSIHGNHDRVHNLTLDDLRTAFHQPREQAAETLGLTVNELKKALKLLGVARWPYRKLASLQSLHADLETQIQTFQAELQNRDDPALAAHINDLKEMQARISDDSSKIMQDPNTPLDEGLHKLRLQNYKARFLGKHGLASAPPMLRMPAPAPPQPPAEAGAGADNNSGVLGRAHSSTADGYNSQELANSEYAAALGRSSSGIPGSSSSQLRFPGADEEGIGPSAAAGRRRRAGGAAFSTKRSAESLAYDSDEDDETASQSSRGSRSNRGRTMQGKAGMRLGAGRGAGALRAFGTGSFTAAQGPATMAALPSLPEDDYYNAGLQHSRLAFSAPLYDESAGGELAGGRHRYSVNALNESVAAISLQQQHGHHQYAAGGYQVFNSDGRGMQFQAGGQLAILQQQQPHLQRAPVPAHLLPSRQNWAAQSQPQLVQSASGHLSNHNSNTGGVMYTGPASAAAIVQQTPGVGGGQQVYTSVQGMPAQQQQQQQQYYQSAQLVGMGSNAAQQGHWAQQAQQQQQLPVAGAQTMPNLAGGYQPLALRPPTHTLRAPSMQRSVQPLPTPLEELLDEMVSASDFADLTSDLNLGPNLLNGPGAAAATGQAQGALGSASAGPARTQHQFQPLSLPNLSQQQQQQQQQGAAVQVTTGAAGLPNVSSSLLAPLSGSVPSAQQLADGSGVQRHALRRMPTSSYFLLNSDDEDDALLANLLQSPPSALPPSMVAAASAAMPTTGGPELGGVPAADARFTQNQQQIQQQWAAAEQNYMRRAGLTSCPIVGGQSDAAAQGLQQAHNSSSIASHQGAHNMQGAAMQQQQQYHQQQHTGVQPVYQQLPNLATISTAAAGGSTSLPSTVTVHKQELSTYPTASGTLSYAVSTTGMQQQPSSQPLPAVVKQEQEGLWQNGSQYSQQQQANRLQEVQQQQQQQGVVYTYQHQQPQPAQQQPQSSTALQQVPAAQQVYTYQQQPPQPPPQQQQQQQQQVQGTSGPAQVVGAGGVMDSELQALEEMWAAQGANLSVIN